ncbi:MULTISPECIES: hypothetical protein [Acidianus]|uniref:Uncharacterized protein n=1 Tax=Candidatus Acidianus copahuensis TaxID=1160895 RepID=A0A031LT03_9CREN|nr:MULTISPECIES: hypothetical protein [Acidianus]EZQ10895.1 hypothetical protein CM19_03240 [Candidatus Acidianus copahuensis]NON62003.1 hypothetical protein [Acidianus sp. RZ1]
MNVRIWREWYEILEKISKERNRNIGDIIQEIVKNESQECIGLPKVKTTVKKKINLKITGVSDEVVIKRIENYLFCD